MRQVRNYARACVDASETDAVLALVARSETKM